MLFIELSVYINYMILKAGKLFEANLFLNFTKVIITSSKTIQLDHKLHVVICMHQ